MATRQLYIDSRMASGTGSDFTLTLNQSVQCPRETVAILDKVIIANTFPTINATIKYIYIQETVCGSTHKTIATLEEGSYHLVDLATKLKEALNVAKSAGTTSNYTVASSVPNTHCQSPTSPQALPSKSWTKPHS